MYWCSLSWRLEGKGENGKKKNRVFGRLCCYKTCVLADYRLIITEGRVREKEIDN